MASRVSFAVGLLLVATLAFFAISPGSASAADRQATFSFTLGTGKSGKALKKAGVRYAAVKPAAQKRLSAKRVRISSSLKSSSRQGEQVNLSGGIKFAKGKRKVVFRKPAVRMTTSPMVIRGTVKGKTIKLFTSKVRTKVEPAVGSVTYKNSVLKLSSRAAKMIKSKLRVKRVPAGKIGGLAGFFQEAFEDPYFEQCDLAATSLRQGSVPIPAPWPDPFVSVATDAAPLDWGIKEGLNGYVNGVGSIFGVDGAIVNRIPAAPPQVPPTGFTFPGLPGEFAENGPSLADDQAILNASGTVVYCNKAHGFRVSIANPTVVIDGANSRIVADVDSNITGEWTPVQRVDFMTLDLSGVAPTSPEAGTVVWPDVPTELSQTGADALRFCDIPIQPGAPPSCLYPAGTAFDPITVSATTSG